MKNFSVLLVLLLIFISNVASEFKVPDDCVLNENKYRLPKSIFPIGYDITLNPSLKTFNYTGTVVIALQVLQDTSCIVINTEDLKFKKEDIVLRSNAGNSHPEDLSISKETLQAIMVFKNKLQKGNRYMVSINFKADIRTDLRGFYKSSYTHQGNTKHLAVTQFEALSARTAFPCYDEPLFRAVFKMKIEINNDEPEIMALSNMPSKVTQTDKKKIYDFEVSPNMSSYLVAFAIGEFEHIEKRALNTNFRIFTTKGYKEEGKFALDVGINCTSWFNDFFQIPYNLPKMDQIAIPDFRAGAMENWGLITYRVALLLRNSQTTQTQIERIASVIVHEIAHMWCGNLVTMEFWNELYLKEGWATFFMVHTTDILFPEWRLWEKQERAKHKFLLSDSLAASPALIQDVNSPSEVDSMFNAISYTKGGALYKMLYEFMGENIFKQWMRYHYKKFAYKATVTNDLFTSLNRFLPQVTVADLRTWTDKAGYPILTVKEVSNNRYQLEQRRFYSETIAKPDNRTWWVPVTMMDSQGNINRFSFADRQSRPFETKDSWFKINKDQFGIYRVSYPTKIWSNLIKAISNKDQHLSELDILGLADDIYALAGTGDVSIKYALDLSLACTEDRSNGVFDTLVENMREISNRIINKPNSIKEKYAQFARKVFEYNIRRLGWERKPGDNHDDIQNRILLLTEAAHFEDKAVIAECIVRYRSNRIPNDLKQLIYDTVVKFGDENYFRDLLKKFENSRDENEKTIILKALTQTQSIEKIEMILEIILGDAVRAQDGSTFYAYMIAFNQKSPLTLWNHFKVNFDKFLKKYSQPILDSRIIQSVTSQFDTKAMHDEVKQFLKTRSDSPYIKLYLASILKKQKYIDTVYADFEKYFK